MRVIAWARSAGLGVRSEHERWDRGLAEAELRGQIPESGNTCSHGGPRVRAAVEAVDPLATEEPVLDELEVGVERQRLIVDRAASRPARPRADHEPGNPYAVAVLIDLERRDVVVE